MGRETSGREDEHIHPSDEVRLINSRHDMLLESLQENEPNEVGGATVTNPSI